MGLLEFFGLVKEDKEPKRKAQEIKKKTIQQQLLRFNKEIENWKTGIACFEDVWNPTSAELISVYNDVVIDAHATACINVRKSKTTSKDFKVVDENGEEIKEQTELFDKQWFRDVIDFALDSKYYGHSLIQLGDRIGKDFTKTSLIPREYVYQQKQCVRQSPYSNEPCFPYTTRKYKPWLVEAGRCDDMGLLMKVSPLVIFKKTALASWASFAEMFGTPLRVGKTKVRDEALRDNMYSMFEQMGGSGFAVIDHDDVIEFVKDSQRDAYKVYDMLVERINGEISKLILGSTMTVDDGSSRSQSEVHETTSNAIVKEDSKFLSEWVNTCLIPTLNRWHGFDITGKWVFDDTEQTTKQEQFDRDIELIKTGKYNIPSSYITETYGTPIEEVEEAEAGELENSLKKKSLSIELGHSLRHDIFCDTCNQIDSSDVPEPDWEDDFVNQLVAEIYAGKITVENLPEELYLRIADLINEGAQNGLEAEAVVSALEDEDFIRALRNNGFQFSAAKTFQQVREMSDFILDADGNLRNFGDYEAKAKEIFDAYNRNWLRTEIAQASNSAQMASKWLEIQEDKDILPFLQYKTVGDSRVRPDHQSIDDVIKPVDDPFWDTFYPPNGWNCRCTVIQLDEAVPTPGNEIDTPDVPDSMKVNVGKSKVLFGPEHPYFIVEDQFSDLKDDNFGLNIPENG